MTHVVGGAASATRVAGLFLLLVALVVSLPLGAAAGAQGRRPTSGAVSGEQRAEVDFGRWLDLRIGMTADEAIATGKVARGATSCGETGMLPPWDQRGYLWFSAVDRLRAVTLFTRRDRTAQDTGVGSTLRSLRAAHPRLSGVQHRRIEGYRLPFVTTRRRSRTVTFQFPADARPGPRTRVRVVSLSRAKPFVFWVAC